MWEGNYNLSYAQHENSVDNQLKVRLEEPPLDAHGYFIQYGHGQNVVVHSQWPKLIYMNPHEEYQHGMNKNDHSTLNFQDVCFSS